MTGHHGAGPGNRPKLKGHNLLQQTERLILSDQPGGCQAGAVNR